MRGSKTDMLKSNDNADILIVGLEPEEKPDEPPLWDMNKFLAMERRTNHEQTEQ